ncbi:MAG: heparinase II/III domain-containing protein [Candidatus Ratteibacteria bacterium]
MENLFYQNRYGLFLLLMCFFCFSSFCYAQTIVFPQHPSFLYTDSEIQEIKRDANKNSEIQSKIKKADEIISQPLVVPEKEGDWIFYYFCPADDAMLKCVETGIHICPVCKKQFTDERTNAAYNTVVNYKLDKESIIVATAYAFTGKERYALWVKEYLLTLAKLYPSFQRHDRWGRKGVLAVVGGRRYAQNLDEAVSAIDLASAYDLVANASCISQQERLTIERLLKNIVKEILKYQIFHGGRNNHQTWFNAAYAVVGLVTGDEVLMKESIYGKYGLLWQIENSITSDGLWYEGTIAYHFYALQAIQYTLDAAKRAGLDFSKSEKLKSMWLGPILMAYPDGKLPVFHDSDPAEIKNYRQFYLWAYRYFKDSVFAKYAGIENPGEKITELKSTNLSGIGVVALRKTFNDNQVCMMLDYGIHGDSHGHPDKLNIVLFANGKEFLLDSGRISYSVPEYKSWCRTTIAHNTVVIDEKDQQPATGKLIYFEDTDQYSACLAMVDSAYRGFVLKRFLVLAENLLVDVFSVEGQTQVQMDWIIHCRGNIVENAPSVKVENLGKENGYQHLKDIKQLSMVFEPVVYQFVQNDKFLKVFLVSNADCSIFTGCGIGYHLKDNVPFVMKRKKGNSAVFITVYDFSGGIKAINTVPVLDEKNRKLPEYQALGLNIEVENKIIEVGFDLREKTQPVLFRNNNFQRIFFNVR